MAGELVGKRIDGKRTDRDSNSRKHPDKALSAAMVRNAAGPAVYCDGNGLYLVVDESGAKRWILRTMVHGKRRHVGLGGVRLVSLAEARDEAVRLRKLARAGGDPVAELRKERREVPTFAAAAVQVHASLSRSFTNPKHAAQWLDSLEEYAVPFFGSRRVDQVESGDVLKALGAIWIEKPETARRVKQRLRAVFEWARASGFRSGDNPVDGVSKVLPKHKTAQEHFAALPYAETGAFLLELRNVDNTNVFVKLAFEFLILTATRTSEVRKARWSEIDFEKKTWTIPAERMKAKKEHRVPLAPRALEILREAQALHAGEFIFPGRSLKHPLSDMAFHMCLRRMKRAGELTPHGFRSSFRDWAEEKTSFPHSVVEAALAHTVKNKVEAAYRRTDLFEKRRKLMDAWASFATETRAKVARIG